MTTAMIPADNSLAIVIPPDIKSEDTIVQLRDAATPFYEQAVPLCEEARAIVVTDVADKKGMADARRVRLALKNLRVDADKARKSLKEESLRKGQAIDTIFNRYRDALAAHEGYLEHQEQFAERVAAEERAKRKKERDAKLVSLGADPAAYSTGDMTDEAFNAVVAGINAQREAARLAAEKAEQERIAREKADAEERERVRIENERLKAEAAAREKQMAEERAKAEKERRRIEAKAKADAEAVEKQRAAERAKAEAERKALEAKARAEAEAREKAERELKSKQEADAKAERERQAAEKKAAAAPDADKLRAFAKQLNCLFMPRLETPDGSAAVRRIINKLAALVTEIEAEADRL